MGDPRERLSGLLQSARDIKDQAQESLGEKADALRGAAARLGDVGQLGSDAVDALGDDVNELLPAIRRAGYSVHAIDIDVALPPKLAVHCRLERQVDAAGREALLEALKEKKIAATAVRMLLRVADLQKRLSVGSLAPRDVVLELGLSPAVKLRYRNQEPPEA